LTEDFFLRALKPAPWPARGAALLAPVPGPVPAI
jgi:hypothetical protein